MALPALERAAAPAHGRTVDVREASVAELVIAARRGDRAAFAGLYQRFHRVVHAVALARVAACDAGDIVQDVFADAWRKLARLRDPAAFPGWILTIARNRAIDAARRRPVIEPAGDLAVAPPPRLEAAAALQAIRALPDTYREALILRLVEGLSGPEIAESTGMSPDSVRVHLHRGMKLLRERLDGEGGER